MSSNAFRKLKIIALTGASACVAATSLVGCARPFKISNNKPSISSMPSSITSSSTITSSSFLDFTPSENTLNEDLNTSYNAYLYSANSSLSAPISAGAFGFATSSENNNADRRLEIGTYNPVYLSLTGQDYDEFVKWVNNQDIVYVYEDLYGIDEALALQEKYEQEYQEQKEIHQHINITSNQIPSKEELTKIINTNSETYLMQHHEYQKLDSSYINLISEIFISELTNYYDDLDPETKEKIFCTLNDLKAVGINSTDFTINDLGIIYNARVTDEGLVMIDPEQISTLKDKNAEERTIAHEVAHLFQRMCPQHKIDDVTQIGGSQYFEDLESTNQVNPLHFQWLYEAAAEQMSMNYTQDKTALVYKNMVGYLHTLDLITLIRPEYEQNSIAISQMSNDPEKLYAVFNATTPEEKKEVINLLYSICYIQNDREDFVTVYEEHYGDISEQETTVKRIMKQSIAKTMTKYFYRNLSERIANSSVTMQDAFYLINVFESALNVHLIYDDETRYELNEDAIKFYIQTQNKFFAMIAENNNLTFEEVEEKFNNYALVIKTDNTFHRNNSFTWLNDEEKQYIADVLTTNISSLTVNIRTITSSNEEQLQKHP